MPTTWRFTRRLKPSARLILSDRGSGTTHSGCTQRASTGRELRKKHFARRKTISRSLKCYSTSESERNKFYQYQLRRFLVLSDPRRLPAVDDGLGDYTQWVHSACPHWSNLHSIQPDRSEWRTTNKQVLRLPPATKRNCYKVSLTLLRGPVLSLLLRLKA